MNYEAINIFTREKEMGKEKRTLVPVGNSNRYLRVLFGIWVKKSGASRGSRTVSAEPKLPSVAIEILRSFFQIGLKRL